MPDTRYGRFWDRQFEEGLPDSRLSGMERERTTVSRARMLWEKIFCASCGVPGGQVIANEAPHVFYICQQCADLYGAPPALQVSSEEESKIYRS